MEKAARGIEAALFVETRPERGGGPTRDAQVGLVHVPDEALEAGARDGEPDDLALRERLLGRFLEGGDVKHARGPQEDRFQRAPDPRVGRGVVPAVSPAHL